MKRVLLFVLTILFITAVRAQVPQQLNYQGIARNASGAPITYQNITVRISLIDSATGGQVAYRETRRVMTNYVGLFNIIIGSRGATNTVGAMQDVNWPTGKKYIKLEIDPNGSSNFSLAGVTQLQSVPYAFSAAPSGNAGGDLKGTYPSPRIADNAITNNNIAEGSISLTKLDQQAVKTLTNKLNISDTAAMLAPYKERIDITNSITGKVNVSDTTEMLNPYYRSAEAVAVITSINTTLNNEITRSTNAENSVITDLAKETTNRTDADASITGNLGNEVTRAKNAEATKEDVANKSTDITTDAVSDTKYPTVKSVKDYVDATATGSSTALASEVTRATNAEGVLTTNLSTETTNREDADNALTANLAAETTNRTDADNAITGNLSSEVSRATAAEATKELLQVI